MRTMSTWSDRKSTRLNSSHLVISYAVFCLKKKKKQKTTKTSGLSSHVNYCSVVATDECAPVPCGLMCGGCLCGALLFFFCFFFFFNDTATTEIYTLSLHDALPI